MSQITRVSIVCYGNSAVTLIYYGPLDFTPEVGDTIVNVDREVVPTDTFYEVIERKFFYYSEENEWQLSVTVKEIE